MSHSPCYHLPMMNANTEGTPWPEAGEAAALVVPDAGGISDALDRVIEEPAVGRGRRVGFIQQRLGGEELPRWKHFARSWNVGISVIFSEDGNGVGVFPVDLACSSTGFRSGEIKGRVCRSDVKSRHHEYIRLCGVREILRRRALSNYSTWMTCRKKWS